MRAYYFTIAYVTVVGSSALVGFAIQAFVDFPWTTAAFVAATVAASSPPIMKRAGEIPTRLQAAARSPRHSK